MKTINRKAWEKARPSLVEDTGIGKAIDAAIKVCPVGMAMEKMKELDQFKAVDKAIKGLKDALQEGLRQIAEKGKDKKAKAEEFKKAKSLLEGWQAEMEDYSLAIQDRQRMVYQNAMDNAQGAKGTDEGAVVKAEREYFTVTKDNLENDIRKLKANTQKVVDAIQKKNADAANLAMQVLRKSLDTSEEQGSPRGLKRELKKYADKHGVDPAKLKVPSFAAALYKEARTYAEKYEKLQLGVDKLIQESAAGITEDGITRTNKTYEKALKEAVKSYREIASQVKKASGPAIQLATQSSRLTTMASDAKVPTKKVVEAAVMFNTKFQEWSQLIVDQLDQTRNKGSPVKKKIDDAGLTPEDNEKVLKPLMAVAYNSNNQVIAAYKLLTRNVKDALETLVEERPNDCEAAKSELGRMSSGAYRVKGDSVGA